MKVAIGYQMPPPIVKVTTRSIRSWYTMSIFSSSVHCSFPASNAAYIKRREKGMQKRVKNEATHPLA